MVAVQEIAVNSLIAELELGRPHWRMEDLAHVVLAGSSSRVDVKVIADVVGHLRGLPRVGTVLVADAQLNQGLAVAVALDVPLGCRLRLLVSCWLVLIDESGIGVFIHFQIVAEDACLPGLTAEKALLICPKVYELCREGGL